MIYPYKKGFNDNIDILRYLCYYLVTAANIEPDFATSPGRQDMINGLREQIINAYHGKSVVDLCINTYPNFNTETLRDQLYKRC